MCKRIVSASVSGNPFAECEFHPEINILLEADAEDIVLTLAGIFGGIPPRNGKAEIRWNTDTSLFVSIKDGAHLPAGISGASWLLLIKLMDAVAQTDDQPLFAINFLERIDEAVDLQPVFETLIATGRQVFIAMPPYYPIKRLEELPYDTAIHTL